MDPLIRMLANLVRGLAGLMGEQRRDWAHALLAETDDQPTPSARLAWLGGGLLLVAREVLMNRIIQALAFAAGAVGLVWIGWPGASTDSATPVNRMYVVGTLVLLAGLPLLVRRYFGLRTVERWVNPRDRVLALLPFYAGLRLGEVVALNTDDIRLSARKGLIIVRMGKGGKYREIPVHPQLHPDLTLWINDERPGWKGAAATTALLLNHHGGRLGARGADNILSAIADHARITDEFTSHALRHTFGTRLIREGYDIVIVAELLGHKRLDQTRRYSLPTQADREKAILSLPTDR
jgi:Phage integrase family